MKPITKQRLRGLEFVDDRVKLTAAVTSSFDPFELLGTESLVDDERVELIDGLAAVCDEVDVGAPYRHWAMRSEARQEVLRTLTGEPGFEELVEHLDVASNDEFGQYLLRGLRGEDLTAYLPDQPATLRDDRATDMDLDALLRAVRFLDELPGRTEGSGRLERAVRRQIAVEEADNALQAAIPEELIGRDDPYRRLRGYIATELSTSGDWVSTQLLTGPGGVGKSALVSQFVVAQRRQAGGAPVVYLDFDRAALVGASSLDLTFEFTRQVGHADPLIEPALSEFRDRSRAVLGTRASEKVHEGGGASFSALRDLASVLTDWQYIASPVVIVLDTFEEVAIRGVTPVRDVLQWLAELRDVVGLTQLHAIVSGREVRPDAPHLDPAEVEAMFNAYHEVVLDDLRDDHAVELLVQLGVERVTADRLAPVFGGNPLVLKLLHRFVDSHDDDDVEELIRDGRKARKEAPKGEVGLRFVYERILERIKDRKVQALAYPGVALRRVTPELILEVLAPHCGERLDVTTLDEARAAFDELARHVWLVKRLSPEVVEHRADTRRLLVPGLEHSSDVDTDGIHLDAARYYAARPSSVPAEVAEIEEIYHLGFLGQLPADIDRNRAEDLVRRLGVDIGFWPIPPRATLWSLAGRTSELTEEEVQALAVPLQQATRGARIEQRVGYGDEAAAEFEFTQLRQLDSEEHGALIPDARWVYLFDQGDFEFLTESARVLGAYDRYFADGRMSDARNLTDEHPWYIALANLMSQVASPRLFSSATLDAIMNSNADGAWWYATALAALADDVRASELLLAQPPRNDRSEWGLERVSDIVVTQAAASLGGFDGEKLAFRVLSADQFRLSNLAEIADRADRPELAARIADTAGRFTEERPDTAELNKFRQSLAGETLVLQGTAELRAAPTTLSFLYGAIRTVLGKLERRDLIDVVDHLQGRSGFWPIELTSDVVDTDFRDQSTARDLSAVVETADRCGLIVHLIDELAARSEQRLSHQLAVGIRHLEGLLFPFA